MMDERPLEPLVQERPRESRVGDRGDHVVRVGGPARELVSKPDAIIFEGCEWTKVNTSCEITIAFASTSSASPPQRLTASTRTNGVQRLRGGSGLPDSRDMLEEQHADRTI